MLAANPSYAYFMIYVFPSHAGISFKGAKLLVIAAVFARRLSVSCFDKKFENVCRVTRST
jgi:hypothetical protein